LALVDERDRQVRICATDQACAEAVQKLRTYRRVAFDIEITRDGELACVGFAGETKEAFVFPAAMLGECTGLLESYRPSKLAANGQFDIHFLSTRCGVNVRGYRDDTQLAWHSCYSQLAGKSEDDKSARTTKKGVAFLASLFLDVPWWKDYEFETEEERYVLCGRDCMYELEIMQALDPIIDSLGVREIYEHPALALVWPCVKMQARGVYVDEELRKLRLEELDDRIDTLREELDELVVPLLSEAELEKGHLFENKWTCPCCRNGSGKRDHCWSCAGLSDSPSKRALVALANGQGIDPEGSTKQELADRLLGPCERCNGVGQRTWLSFNPDSVDQKIDVIYNVLKLPPRMKKGKLSTEAEKIRSLLPLVSGE
jgi:DNA polymerase I-like protein with 3'-5' exonuclease and polymerase domains